jgi:chromosome segregation ATPase
MMPEIDANELRRLRRLEARLAKATRKTRKAAAEKRKLQSRLSTAEKLAERTERAEAASRESSQALDAERKESANRVHAAEEKTADLSAQVNALVEENRRLAEQLDRALTDLEPLSRAGEEARQAAEAARAEAKDATDARERIEEATHALEDERDRFRARAETAVAQLEQEGQPVILPTEEVRRIVAELVNDLRGNLTGLSVREGEVKLKVAFGGAGEHGGFILPTLESGPEIRDVLSELTLRFE